MNSKKVTFKHGNLSITQHIFFRTSNHECHNFVILCTSNHKMIFLYKPWCHQGPLKLFWSVNDSEIVAFYVVILNKITNLLASSYIRHVKGVEHESIRKLEGFFFLFVSFIFDDLSFFLKFLFTMHDCLGVPEFMLFH